MDATSVLVKINVKFIINMVILKCNYLKALMLNINCEIMQVLLVN